MRFVDDHAETVGQGGDVFEHPVAGDEDPLILWPYESFLVVFHQYNGTVWRPLADLFLPCGYATRGGDYENVWLIGEEVEATLCFPCACTVEDKLPH